MIIVVHIVFFFQCSFPILQIPNIMLDELFRAVRRAEQFAETSGRDPRHVGVPRDTSDDILKKVGLSPRALYLRYIHDANMCQKLYLYHNRYCQLNVI